MTRIERMKQKAILDVAESLGYSFKRLSGQVYEHPEHDSFRIFADTNKNMLKTTSQQKLNLQK